MSTTHAVPGAQAGHAVKARSVSSTAKRVLIAAGVATYLGATVAATTSTTVAMSAVSVPGVGSGVTITFGDYTGDETMSVTALTSGQTVTVDYRLLTAPGP